MKAYERLLEYVTVWTSSDENSTTVPSAAGEFDLARMLVAELKGIGIEDVELDDKCYVYATLPATPGYEDKTAIGLIAHIDTATEYTGKDVKPQIIENYDGGDVVLGESGKVLSVADFPHLKELKGRTLITTDGTTLLGADDKAGIAEIITVLDEIIKENIPHGKICIGFTPDEEIGRGTDYFDLKKFGADFAYTLDGHEEGHIEFENFNASTAHFKIHGNNVHTGSAKNILVNSQLIAMELAAMFPADERPENTEGYEGFYHFLSINGNVELTTVRYAVREHDSKKFEEREAFLYTLKDKLNSKYGEGVVELEIVPAYRNMREKIENCMHLVDNALAAIREVGLEPNVAPARGGTDGAVLSFKGLPCPNLGTGGHAYHGPYEHITIEGMDIAVEILKKILILYAK